MASLLTSTLPVPPRTFTTDEMRRMLHVDQWPTINQWLGNRWGVAVYENQAQGSPYHGELQFVPYGDPFYASPEPSPRTPTVSSEPVKWYGPLIGIYRGHYLIDPFTVTETSA